MFVHHDSTHSIINLLVAIHGSIFLGPLLGKSQRGSTSTVRSHAKRKPQKVQSEQPSKQSTHTHTFPAPDGLTEAKNQLLKRRKRINKRGNKTN